MLKAIHEIITPFQRTMTSLPGPDIEMQDVELPAKAKMPPHHCHPFGLGGGGGDLDSDLESDLTDPPDSDMELDDDTSSDNLDSLPDSDSTDSLDDDLADKHADEKVHTETWIRMKSAMTLTMKIARAFFTTKRSSKLSIR
ncbi:uncharacterized protein N7496_003221 [Penicillium cataractarum]|uniref:Uncharacterized protein n=1 Tax=Penicillium cataractarum TaxID=2100454 RepID=A0A9W9SLJ9_9EURO|nr:uncharacterized protein N7496_003221 [Penicillium cataractarum]KAJ5380793.1 hypothetical protein N7496_003221 [Penicillium cataractarum]